MHSIAATILLASHVVVSLFIVLLVLVQRPRSEGLGIAFGTGMTDYLLGPQTAGFLQSLTRYMGAAFFLLTFALSVLYAK